MQQSYRRALRTLNEAEVAYLVGGAHGLGHYTGIYRDTKDLDLFVLPEDRAAGLEALETAGYRTAVTYPHWLAKASDAQCSIDIIFSSGNAIGTVDRTWFAHAVDGDLFDTAVRFCPPEEIIWTKAFVMERERYDGADILHLLLARGRTLDWTRLCERFGPHWRVLFSHQVLFGLVYPSRRSLVPAWLLRGLSRRLEAETMEEDESDPVCRGTLLSRSQYDVDVEAWGYKDARRIPIGKMTAEEIASWRDGAV